MAEVAEESAAATEEGLWPDPLAWRDIPEVELVSIPALVKRPDRLADVARDYVIEVLRKLIARERDPYRTTRRPEGYSDDAVMRRARQDLQGDIDSHARAGWTYTEDELAEYTRLFLAAWLATWRDPALLAELRAEYGKRGFIIVCMRGHY